MHCNYLIRLAFHTFHSIVILHCFGFSDETKWIAVGSLHNWFSSAGCEREIGRTHLSSDQQDGLRWPAQFKWQDTQASKALWIGTVNYDDPLVNQTFPHKVVHVGPRFLDDQNEFMPQEFSLIGRFDHPVVYVDGLPASDLEGMDDIDQVNEALAADRVMVNIVNTSLGITMTRKIYAFTNPYHSNYMIYDFSFKNNGICNNDGTVTHLQTLEGVIFYFLYRYAIAREGCHFGYAWLPQSATWGHNTMNDVVGEDPSSPDPFRALFSWHGLHSAAGFDNIGGPNASGDGRLGAAQYVGVVTLHADVSSSNQSDDPYQPTTTWYLGSDYPITDNSPDQFNAARMTAEYSAMSAGHPSLSHAEEVGNGYANQWSEPGHSNPGGYSQAQGFGPYTLPPGDSIRIVLAEGGAGLDRSLCYTIGDEWLNGNAPYTLPDGSTTNNPDLFKNAWVSTGKDSLFQTFNRAVANYSSGFSVPSPPPPPGIFEVISSNDRVMLFWDNNAEADQNFAGYRIYRAVHRPDTTYNQIYDGPAGINHFDDTTVVQGYDYYYYIISYDNGTTNTIEPGVPLNSSLFWTRNNQPAHLQNEPVVNADLYVSPGGSDNNNGLTPDSALQTITAALDRIAGSILNPHNIYLANGIYSPSLSGETFPLYMKSAITLSGSTTETTILDAENQGTIIYCQDDINLVVENVTLRNGLSDLGGGIFSKSSQSSLRNVTIRENIAGDKGGGIYADNSSIMLHNVTIKDNSADVLGGGIYFANGTEIEFDLSNSCNIYNNSAPVGFDIASAGSPITDVIVDTFTVLYPNDYFTFPQEHYTCDINHYTMDQVDADLYVSPTGDDNNSGLSPADPLQTVTRALVKILADELHPHTIHLAEGIYTPTVSWEHYPLYGRSHLSFSGAGRETTVLDAEGESHIFHCTYDSSFAIENLTIQNGSSGYGGGIYCQSSSPMLSNLTIQDNTAIRGGGIDVQNSHIQISDVIIRENTAQQSGGGMACSGGITGHTTIDLEHTTISENSSTTGGGISLADGISMNFDAVSRCSIFLNSASEIGNDLYSSSTVFPINVVVDTFTVLYPTDEYAFPVESFTFDILNYVTYQAEADLYVHPNGNNENNGLSAAEPLQTISQALSIIFADSARPHTIHLAEGTYAPSTNGETFPLLCKSHVSLIGSDAATTILDAEGSSGILRCEQVTNLRFENISLRNGSANKGGGLFCAYSDPDLEQIIFSTNLANQGGGLYAEMSNLQIQHCEFAHNLAVYGGSYYLKSSGVVFDHTLIYDDSAQLGGAGFMESSSPAFVNVTISENSGGTTCKDDSHPSMINTISWNNYPYEVLFFRGWNSIAVSYSDIRGGETGIVTLNNGEVLWQDGNFSSDPLFCNPDTGNYYLAENSPCIGTGENGADIGAYDAGCPALHTDYTNAVLPTSFRLRQNYPNPFNSTTIIAYDLPIESEVQLVIYDILGRHVRTLVQTKQEPGFKTVIWDCGDAEGQSLGSSLYFYRLRAGDFTMTKKMTVLK